MGGLANLSTFETIQNRQNQSIGYSGDCFSPVKNDLLVDDPMFSGLFGSWIDDVDVLEFVNSVYHKASGILLSHMVKKNIFLFPFWGVTKIIMVIVSLISSIFMFKTYSENTL